MGVAAFDKFLEEVKQRSDVASLQNFTPSLRMSELSACNYCGRLFEGFGYLGDPCGDECRDIKNLEFLKTL